MTVIDADARVRLGDHDLEAFLRHGSRAHPLRWDPTRPTPTPAGADSAQAVMRGVLARDAMAAMLALPPAERTRSVVDALVAQAWTRRVETAASGASAHVMSGPTPASLQASLDQVCALLDRWFTLEDPAMLAPIATGARLDTTYDGVVVSSVVDRVDSTPHGELRLVSYLPGRARDADQDAHDGVDMFVALVSAVALHRSGAIVRRVQLLYLGSGEVVVRDVDDADLAAAERKIVAVVDAMTARPRRSGERRTAVSRARGTGLSASRAGTGRHGDVESPAARTA